MSHWRVISVVTVAVVLALSVAGCWPRSTPPVLKIGLIAPFEGPSRPLGYSTLYAVRMQLQAWNETSSGLRVELVALNDDGDPVLAAQLAAQLAADPDVVVVLGPPQSHTARLAAPTLAAAGLPTFSLAPLPAAAPPYVLPYGGVAADIEAALADYLPMPAHVAWAEPVHEPVIWLGDHLTLAGLLRTTPELVAAAGPVASEQAFAQWMRHSEGAGSAGLLWAAAQPVDLAPDFAIAYSQATGATADPTTALAYAAAGQALQLISQFREREAIAAALAGIHLPPIQVFQRQGFQCCNPMTDPSVGE